MKIYKITFNEYSYDEYDSFIVAANSKREVVSLIKEEKDEFKYYSAIDWGGGYKIEEIKVEDYKYPTIILESYNAG